MSGIMKCAPLAFGVAMAFAPVTGGMAAVDIDKAHSTAIQNCINWNGDSKEYCTCVQDRVRTNLSSESYVAMMEFAQAYQENRRADMAAMQVNAEMSKALEPVDAVVTEARQACKG